VVLEAEKFALVLQMVFDIEFDVVLQGLGLIGVACYFTLLNHNLEIFRVVNNPHGLAIGLCTVRYEAFEVWLWNSM
jgi:hypothetical protein